jgi:predicted HicB family RNase H-like nuclease
MDLTSYTAELRDSLLAAASVGDESTKAAVAALSTALEPAARLAIISALSAMAKDLNTQLADSAQPGERIVVSVALDGRDVSITTQRSWSGEHTSSTSAGSATHSESTSSTSAASSAESAARSFAEASGDLTRTTVRMFNELKGQAERAAAEQGVSLNAFISRAVADSIRGEKAARRAHRHGEQRSDSHISGFVQG